MKNKKIALALVTLLGLALAVWLILYGLQLRFFGTFINRSGLLSLISPPQAFITWVGWISARVAHADLGWPLLVVGCSLLGSIAGLWLRQRWAPRSLLIFSIASFITLHWMNVLSILLVLLISTQALEEWMTSAPASHA